MINVVALIQLKAFARQDGAILAAIWTASFLLAMYSPQSALSSLLAVSTPFVVAWRMRSFRNNALDGQMSFKRGLAYACYVFFYGSLLFALVQFVYFRFLDHGQFMSLFDQSLKMFAQTYQDAGVPQTEIDNTYAMFRQMKPVELSFIFMMQNLLLGFVMSMFLALIYQKRQRRNIPKV